MQLSRQRFEVHIRQWSRSRYKAITVQYHLIYPLPAMITSNIIHNISMTVLEQHNILRGKRHRFRVRISTLTQLVPTTEEIAKHLETEKDQVDVILLDFVKALDKVAYCKLLHKPTATFQK
jgi:deoxyxylulose-5-phosphate synthase